MECAYDKNNFQALFLMYIYMVYSLDLDEIVFNKKYLQIYIFYPQTPGGHCSVQVASTLDILEGSCY